MNSEGQRGGGRLLKDMAEAGSITEVCVCVCVLKRTLQQPDDTQLLLLCSDLSASLLPRATRWMRRILICHGDKKTKTIRIP